MPFARVFAAGAVTVLVMAPPGPAGAHADDVARPHADQRAVVPLPPVTEHPIDAAILASRPAAPTAQRATQVVRLVVVGGDLRLDHDAVDVTLTPTPSRRIWTASLPPVRVVDARGTHEGWRVRWETGAVVVDGELLGANVRVEAAAPVVIDGVDDGLVAGDGHTLGRAVHGWGGGTYELGGTVTVRLPASVRAETVTVQLAYTVR